MAKKPIRGHRLPPSASRSGSSRSPSPRSSKRSPGARQCSSPPPSKSASPPSRIASLVQEIPVLLIDKLSRNVNEDHLREIFSNFGEVVRVELALDRRVNLPKGYAYVEFKMRADAEKALLHMDGGQIDGNVVQAKFTLPQRQKSPPPKSVVTSPKTNAVKADGINSDKDGPKRLREGSPRQRPTFAKEACKRKKQ